MKTYRYYMPTEVISGVGAFDAFGPQCRPLGRRALLVTGRRSARAAGLLDRAFEQFPGAALYDCVGENPTIGMCEAGAAVCRGEACDYVVGLGGGSAMDAAKAIACLAANPGTCEDYFGADRYPERPLPIAAAPTTAGTGSEVTPYAVLVDEQQRSKRTLSGRNLFPRVAVLDPALSVSLPPAVTAATGLDALSQAMEGMISKKSAPVGDTLALETCRIVRQWLPRAVAHGADLEARGWMLHAAMLSGCVIAQSGTTLVHAMGYYYTLECGLAHGLANALLLAPLFQFNARHQPEATAALARALGVDSGNPARDIGVAIHAVLRSVGVAPAARDAGVPESRLDEFAACLFNDTARFKNQPGAMDIPTLHRLFRLSYEGRLEEE